MVLQFLSPRWVRDHTQDAILKHEQTAKLRGRALGLKPIKNQRTQFLIMVLYTYYRMIAEKAQRVLLPQFLELEKIFRTPESLNHHNNKENLKPFLAIILND